MEWQPIQTALKGKRLCKDGLEHEKLVIVWASGCRFARQNEAGQWIGVMGRPLTVSPTYWMPLPDPPEAE